MTVKPDRQQQKRKYAENYGSLIKLQQINGRLLTSWCKHMYIMNEVGLGDWSDSKEIFEFRLMNPLFKYLVFLDLDETLTKTNEAPPDFPRDGNDRVVDEYFLTRVPPELRKQVKTLFTFLKNRPDIGWFILTDNLFIATKCSLKLGHDIDAPLGSIVDRYLRSKFYSGMTKAKFLKYVIEKRLADGLPTKTLFVDNDSGHRQEATSVLASIPNAITLVCCQNLVAGLNDKHIEQIENFLNGKGEKQKPSPPLISVYDSEASDSQ